MIKKFSATYTGLEPNFVINIPALTEYKVSKDDAGIIAVAKNILNRSCLLPISTFLVNTLGTIEPQTDFQYLDDKNSYLWTKTIKGGTTDNPALTFYNQFLITNLNNNYLLKNSFIPELPFAEVILGDSNNQKLKESYLDFYSPLLNCAIEIDGKQHENDQLSDQERDELLERNGITVFRIKTSAIAKPCKELQKFVTEQLKKFTNQQKFIDEINHNLLNYNACIRYQFLILYLLEQGVISLHDSAWEFNVQQNEFLRPDLLQIAIQDLLIYFDNLLILYNGSKTAIEIKVNLKEISPTAININLDVLRKYDDTCTDKQTIYISNDYFPYNIYARTNSALYTQTKNYYQVANGKIKYDLKNPTDEQHQSLLFFLKTIFYFDDFRPKQEEIIIECLTKGGVIGLLPTGAGKSLCYQYTSFLLPGMILVISPLKILMQDQYENMLHKSNIANICYVNSSNKKALPLLKYNQSKITLISPERFFNDEFLTILETKQIAVSLVAIDEVHCLSEWGHDFRTSYLCLTRYLKKCMPTDCKVLGLTATASPRVIEDVEIEFNYFKGYTKIIYAESLKRSNLNLTVQQFSPDVNKYATLLQLYETPNAFNEKTIVFTRTKSPNQIGSCCSLCNSLSHDKDYTAPLVDWFAGGNSDNNSKKDDDINSQKLARFKSGETKLLLATKAFGMGVDIPDIRRTIHYALPSSIESLYQEFGRAGRDGQDSNCLIWFYQEDETMLNALFNEKFTIKNVNRLRDNYKEFKTNLFFLTNNNLDIEEELFIEEFLYEFLCRKAKSSETVEFTTTEFMVALYDKVGVELGEDRYGNEYIASFNEFYQGKFNDEFKYEFFIEKALYRLFLLNKISIWEIKYSADLSNPLYTKITVNHPTIKDQTNSLLKYVTKYEPMYQYNEPNPSESSILKALITWAFDHFVYQHLQSIKNIYQVCRDYQSSQQFMQVIIDYLNHSDKYNNLIADIKNYNSWFKLLKETPIPELKAVISRYLESDDKLVSLNFISGLIRLITYDYEDSDGERRMISAFETISTFDAKDIDAIIKQTYEFLPTNDLKDTITDTILDVNENLYAILYRYYQNERLDNTIVVRLANKINSIGEKINAQFRKN